MIRLSLQKYKLAEDSALYAARKTFFMLIDQGKEVESQFYLCEDNDEKGRKVLQEQWFHVKQQIGQTELTIFNLLQKPDEHLL